MFCRPFDVVLFDLDGTLVDSAGDLAAAVDEMRSSRGLPELGAARYRSMAGTGARGMLGIGFGIAPGPPLFNAMREEFFATYQKRLTRTTVPFPGVTELLASLHDRGLPWGIVTNKAARFSEPLITALSELRGAKTLVSGDTTPYSKPHPAPLLEAARRMQASPDRCVYVGDDERDIVAGRAAGMLTAVAGWGYLGAEPSLPQWNADWILKSPDDLMRLSESG